jgi:hypothetical protein
MLAHSMRDGHPQFDAGLQQPVTCLKSSGLNGLAFVGLGAAMVSQYPQDVAAEVRGIA